MASGHTVMHLQRKLKDLQRQRCRRGGSQEPRVLGMVAPTMRTPVHGHPLATSSGSLHSHRGLQPQSSVARAAGRDLDDYALPTRTLATPTKGPKDPAPGIKDPPPLELMHPGSTPVNPTSEYPHPGRAVPAVTVPFSALTSNPWRADTAQGFPVMPAIGFLPPAGPPADGHYFQRDPANAANFPPHSREVLWPLPGYPGVFPDHGAVPPSYQYPTYVPHVPLHPSWYRLDMSPVLYKKNPIHPSELSAFSPLRLSHPSARDTSGVRTPALGVGPRSSCGDGSRKVKEGTAIHRSRETKPVSELPHDVLTNVPERPQKEWKGQRIVAMGRTRSREGGKPDKGCTVPADELPTSKPHFIRQRRGSSTSAPSWADFQDLGQTRDFRLWQWVSLRHTDGGKPQLLTKEGPLSHVSPPVKAKLRDGLSRRDGEKCLPQVNSGSHLRHLLAGPRDSLTALDLSPRIRRNRNRDEHKTTRPSPVRPLDESCKEGAHVSPPGHQESGSLVRAENEQRDAQGHRSARCCSMPNLLLTHNHHGECKRLKDFSRSDISAKKALQKKDLHLTGGPPQGGAKLNVRVPADGHLAAGGCICAKCTNGSNPNKRALAPPETRGEDAAQESAPVKASRLGHTVPPAYTSSCATSNTQAQHEVLGNEPEESAKKKPGGDAPSLRMELTEGNSPNQALEETAKEWGKQKKLFFTLLHLQPQTCSDEEEDSHQHCVDGLPGMCSQTAGVSVLDLTTSSLSSDEETVDISLECQPMGKHCWHGVEGILEMYRSYIEETTFEEKILLEQLKLSKEKNNELNLMAKNLSVQIQDLQTSKENLEAEQRIHEAALAQLKSCLVLV